MNASNAIHKAERLVCGCSVDTLTGDIYTRCARHACFGVVSFKELPEYALQAIPLPKHPDGLRVLCPACSSYRIRPNTDNIICRDCGHVFMPADVVGFALSVDSKPVQCRLCMDFHYGPCSCNQMSESGR